MCFGKIEKSMSIFFCSILFCILDDTHWHIEVMHYSILNMDVAMKKCVISAFVKSKFIQMDWQMAGFNVHRATTVIA